MNRRRWLQISAGAIPAALAPFAMGREGTGKWNDENIAEYCLKLFAWLRANFESRASQLKLHGDGLFELKYDYLAPSEDRKKIRLLEKFEEGRLSGRAADEHIVASLKEFEAVRKTLAGAEAAAAKTWVSKSDSIVVKNGRIFDTDVSSGRLSVILDSSPSMTPYLEKLRVEISRDFADAYFVEVDGCHLDRGTTYPWFFSAPVSGVNPFTPNRHIPEVPAGEQHPYSKFLGWTRDSPGALQCMADLMHSDAIYWFCDFDDSSSDSVIKGIARKLLDKKVKLFVHSLDKRPPSLITLLAERSGGKVIRKRI